MGGAGAISEVTDNVIASLNIPEDELTKRSDTGALIVRNDIAWARNTLRHHGIIDNSVRGVWRLTPIGASVQVNENMVDQWIRDARNDNRLSREKNKERKFEAVIADSELPMADTLEVKEEHFDDMLLQRIKELSPIGFEKFSRRLLFACGITRIELTAPTNDHGIDGSGDLEFAKVVRLKVLFQCKRYDKTIAPSHIRDFRGAMHQNCDKGIFITTGRFSKEAQIEARRDASNQIELIDGRRLVELTKEFELGVKPVTEYIMVDGFFSELELG